MSHLNFSWTHDTEGKEIFYRLYEDDVLVVDNIEELNFSLLMDGKPFKTYRYHVTAVSKETNLESAPSNAVEVPFQAPKSPKNLKAYLAA
jgi:hypothetical protein